MDSWQVAQNYIVAAAIGGAVGGYYYYTSKQKMPNRTGSQNAIATRRSETDLRGRVARRNTREEARSANATPESRQGSATARKRRARAAEPQVRSQPSLESIPDEKAEKESDMSAAQFARQMQQARQGSNLSSSKNKETRVKTVKAKAANNASFDEDEPHVTSPSAGDVSDMLEPVAPGPASIRITAPSEPQKVRAPKQAKQEAIETKKQRQQRKKTEERKLMQQEAEKERKILEEKQRRTAREARGEPAKNGLGKAPLANPWEQRNTNTVATLQNGEAISSPNVMLDTFDAESTSSSNGGPGASTAATSTTSGDQPRWDTTSEEEQMSAALKQSSDESGWTTVSTGTKKPKKSSSEKSGAATPVTTANGHTRGGAYAALAVEDSSAWEA